MVSQHGVGIPSIDCVVARETVRRAARGFCLALITAFATHAAQACPPASTIADYVFGGGLCLAASTFGVDTAGASPVLVAVVHGDISDFGAASYHVNFARALARPGVIVVEESADAQFAAPEGFAELERRRYDDTELIFLRLTPA